MSGSVGLMWFRRDLRLAGNPAWAGATAEHRQVTALFVLDARLQRAAGPFRTRQLVAELHALDAALRAREGRLLVHHGDPAAVVPRVAAAVGATRVHWNADVTPWATARDEAVRRALPVAAATPYGHLVLPPGSVVTAAGRAPRVFGAFHRSWLATRWDAWPEPGDATIAADAGDPLPHVDGEPPCPAGEAAGQGRLLQFVEGVGSYTACRDDLGAPGTSELSVALHFGTISPREVVETVRDTGPSAGGDAFIRQLAWRDWFAHLLAEEPSLTAHALRPELDAIAWRDDPEGFEAWSAGRTGYPLVDAGMRELAATGRLHNRVAHGGRLLPREGPPDRLAPRRAALPPPAAGRRRRPERRQLAVGRRHRTGRRRPTSACSTRSRRAAPTIAMAPICGDGSPSSPGWTAARSTPPGRWVR